MKNKESEDKILALFCFYCSFFEKRNTQNGTNISGSRKSFLKIAVLSY